MGEQLGLNSIPGLQFDSLNAGHYRIDCTLTVELLLIIYRISKVVRYDYPRDLFILHLYQLLIVVHIVWCQMSKYFYQALSISLCSLYLSYHLQAMTAFF